MSAGVVAAHYVDSGTPDGGAIATLTVPAGKVSADLTGFPVCVDLAGLPAGWWSSVAADGGNIRVRQGGADLPVDLIDRAFVKGEQRGELYFRADLLTAVANVFTVEVVTGLTRPGDTSPIGRNAVWADFDVAIVFPEYEDRTGNGRDWNTAGIVEYRLNWSATGTASPTGHTQGVAVAADGSIIANSEDELVRYTYSAGTWTEVDRNSTPIADSGISGVTHCGDSCVVGDELFVPVELYPSGPYTNQHVAVFDALTLTFLRSYDISANEHETSSICWNPDTGLFYITDYTATGTTPIHKYDTDFNYVGPFTTSAAVTNIQGIIYRPSDRPDLDAGEFIVTQNEVNNSQRIKVATGQVVGHSPLQGSSGTNGGLAFSLDRQTIYLLKTGPQSIQPMVEAALPAAYPRNWFHEPSGGGYGSASAVPQRTAWTLGATYLPEQVTGDNRTVAHYTQQGAGSTSTYRATMNTRNTTGNPASLWNASNSWLQSGYSPGAGVARRWHMQQNGTTARSVWVDGIQRASGGTVQKPSGSSPCSIYLGSPSEKAIGSFKSMYLRNGLLPASWLAAENANWMAPGTFYAIS